MPLSYIRIYSNVGITAQNRAMNHFAFFEPWKQTFLFTNKRRRELEEKQALIGEENFEMLYVKMMSFWRFGIGLTN